MNVDEILSNATGTLPEGAVSSHAIVIIQYSVPNSDIYPGRLRLAYVSDEDCPPWIAMGMLRFAERMEFEAVLADDE